MKEEVAKLKNFLKVVGLSGARVINEIILNLEEDTINVSAKTLDKTVALRGIVKANPFGITDKLGIADLGKFIQYLDVVDVTSFKVEENRITIKGGKKKVSALLKVTEFIKDTTVVPALYDKLSGNLKGGIEFSVDVASLQAIENYLKITGADYFTLAVSKGVVKVVVGTKNTDKLTEEIGIDYSGDASATLTLKTTFIEAIRNLSGNVTLTVKNDAPVKVYSKTDDLEVELLIAQAQ